MFPYPHFVYYSRDALLRILNHLLDRLRIVYDRADNESLENTIKSIQCSASIAKTGATQETCRECRCQELVLGSLCHRCRFL